MPEATSSGLSGGAMGIQAAHTPCEEAHHTMAASESLEDGMLAALPVAVTLLKVTGKSATAVLRDLAPRKLRGQFQAVTLQELAGRQDLCLAAPSKDP